MRGNINDIKLILGKNKLRILSFNSLRSWSTIMQEIWKKSEKIQRNSWRKG